MPTEREILEKITQLRAEATRLTQQASALEAMAAKLEKTLFRKRFKEKQKELGG